MKYILNFIPSVSFSGLIVVPIIIIIKIEQLLVNVYYL